MKGTYCKYPLILHGFNGKPSWITELFRSTLAGMNIDEAQAIKQASLDRYNNR